MYSFVSKKTVPFVLSAAVAFSAFTGVIATPVTNDTPLAASTAYAAASKTWDFSQNVGAWSYCGGYNCISRAKAVDGSNLKKVHVRVLLMDKFTGKLSHLEVSLVSYLSGYKGAVYINNLSL